MTDAHPETMRQYAAYPTVLAELVAELKYRPGWTFKLEDIERDPADSHGTAAGGLTFVGLTGTRVLHGGPGGWTYEGRGHLVRCDGGPHSYEGAEDAYHPGVARPVYFYFPVPAATYDRRSWRRWLFERLLDVERHEAMEHFQIGADRPFSPSHGPGNDPYMVREYGEAVDRRTSFRGKVNPA